LIADVYGMIARLRLKLEKMFSVMLNTPMTWNGLPLMRSVRPIGSRAPNIASASGSDSSTTARRRAHVVQQHVVAGDHGRAGVARPAVLASRDLTLASRLRP
jgi:hypothetical protein